MALTKQARTLTPQMEKRLIEELKKTRYPQRNLVIFLLSCKAGLRAKEIASVTWSMICDTYGEITNELCLPNYATKGKNSGRNIPLNKELKQALMNLKSINTDVDLSKNIIISERNKKHVSAHTIVNFFDIIYKKCGYTGCSSHSGRRTFITNSARKISSVGGSLKDVQDLAGHSSLQMTQRYIDENKEAKQKLVDLI